MSDRHDYDDDWPDEYEQERLLTFNVITASAPPSVEDRYRYWSEAPPELSDRCVWWLKYLADNDQLDNTLTVRQLVDLTPPCANYDDSAEALGIYLWEWHHILYHVIYHRIDHQRESEERAKRPDPTWLFMNPEGSPININDLPGATRGTIKISGFVSQKPDWSTEELEDSEDDDS